MFARENFCGLGPRTARALYEIDRSLKKRGFPPTMRELAVRIDVRSTSVVKYHMTLLELYECVTVTRAPSGNIRARTTRVTKRGARIARAWGRQIARG